MQKNLRILERKSKVEIDPTTGLPIEALAWEDVAKGQQKIDVKTEKRRFGKISTLISGFDDGVDIKDIAKTLKAKRACGGTFAPS